MKNQTADQLHSALADLAPPLRVTRQLHAATLRRAADELPESLPSTSPRLLARIRERVVIPRLEQVDRRESNVDGFVKYVFRGDGDGEFEAVRIPLLHRVDDPKYVVCVSSQVGCALACAFCATGRLGFRRNLAPWEIVDQVVRIQAESPHPVRGVVFMGMGEPLLNYHAVIMAARIFSEPCGLAIAAKSITISTAGVVPGIRRFTDDRLPYRLIVSLSSAISERRVELLPIERAHPLPELIEVLREYHATTKRRVTLAWTVMAGVNDSREEARALAQLTRGLPIMIDLIDVNDDTGRFRRATDEELNRFRDILREEVGAPVQRRYSGGQDIAGACGMLAARVETGVR